MRAKEDEKDEKCRDLVSDVRGTCAVKARVIIETIGLKGEEKALI